LASFLKKAKKLVNFSTMKKLLKTLSISLFALTALFFVSADSPGLPSVKLKNLKGQSVDIQDFAKSGKPVVISFWATWCSPCKKELSNIAEIYDQWKEEYGVEIVAVSIDDARSTDKVKSYVNATQWPFTVLLDPNEDMRRALNFSVVPYTLLLDKKGNIVYTHNNYVEGDEFILEEKIKKVAK
jgi:cytochrome c biogenesis protein CcmG/thiol:disulfide interchange protein DsbE